MVRMLQLCFTTAYLHKYNSIRKPLWQEVFQCAICCITPCCFVLYVFSDCAEEITRYYGSGIVWFFPEQAEYIEFMKLGREDLIQVVWNRSDPQILLDSTRRGSWEIDSVTQADSGVYNLRRKDASLLRRKRLTVVGEVRNLIEVA